VRQIISKYFHIPDTGPAYWKRIAELHGVGSNRGAP
jgi:hypothetical protein